MALTDKPITLSPIAPIDGALKGAPNYQASGATTEVKPSDTSDTAEPAGQTAPKIEAKPVAADEQARKDAIMGYDRQIDAVWQAMSSLEPPETPEQRAKREKQEKAKRIVGAISDGLRAMSNLYFTTQYAPNMYNHDNDSHLKATNAHIEKLKAEREKNRDAYLNYAIILGNAENGRAATLRELEALQEKMKMAREKAEQEAEKHKKDMLLFPEKFKEQQQKANKAESDAAIAAEAAKNAPERQAAELETERAKKGSYEASAARSRAAAAASNRSNVAEFTAWDEHGDPHKFRTEAAALAYARQHGTLQETDVSETEVTESRLTPESKPRTRSSTTTKKQGHAGKPSPTGGKKSPTA